VRHALAVALLCFPLAAQDDATTRVWTKIPLPYFFQYAPGEGQPIPAPSGPWTFLFPGALDAPVADQLGCQWNAPAGPPYYAPAYWPPPYWYAPPYTGGIDELSGPIMRGYGAVGASSHDPPLSVGIRGMGFAANIPGASWDNGSQQLLGMYFASDNCFSGDLEYGFAHYYQYGITQFYFYNYSNCSDECFLVGTTPPDPLSPPPSVPVTQCSAAINLPPLPPNDNGDYNYFYSAAVYLDPPTGHYRIAAAVTDLVSGVAAWSCMVDPFDTPNFQTPTYPTSAPCYPQPSDYVNYSCTVNGRSQPYPISKLYYAPFGAVVAGVVNPPNTALAPDTAVTVNQVTVLAYPH